MLFCVTNCATYCDTNWYQRAVGRRREEEDPDRYLHLRGGYFHYRRPDFPGDGPVQRRPAAGGQPGPFGFPRRRGRPDQGHETDGRVVTS